MSRPRAAAALAALLTPLLAFAQPPPSDEPSPAAGPSRPPLFFHIAGYADVTYTDIHGDGVAALTLAPIVHVQMGDRWLIETEVELEANDRGDQEAALEYATLNWMVTDRSAIVLGKFLSPVGYYFQNLHPSWINKLASVPAGFGHGGAAPLTDVGIQWRGGADLADGHHLNYALYVANGPRLGLEGMDDLDLDAEGSSTNRDGKRVWGGRLGWMPVPTFELGASLTRGQVRLDPGEMFTMPEPGRRYRVEGADFAWRMTRSLDVRGEWIRQRVGDAAASAISEGGTWRAWYVQGAHRFGSERWELALRVGDSLSPHGESTFEQTAIGLNYLFQPQTLLKLSWEFNTSDNDEANADRVLLQFAHGL
jgi:hypothetical protein